MLCTGEGGTSRKIGLGVRHASWNTYSISDPTLWFSLPYFRPDQKFDTLFQIWPLNQYLNFRPSSLYFFGNLLAALVYNFRSALVQNTPGSRRVNGARDKLYSTYTVGVNVKREMVLSPNHEEVASSKRHTQFKTRVYKPCLFQTKMVKIDNIPYPLAPHMPI